ncbi:MAG: MaoC family dehydratase [Ignavibacteria bacterium]|nr:MaoC family dehydratase [Ignavibacteria bacterium]
MTKQSISNYFENFSIGTLFHCPTPRVLTDADRVAYIALTGDRSPLYCTTDGLIHPLIVFHTVLGQTVRQISLNAVANLGYAELRWHHPVFVGDQIRTEAEIVGLKENSNRRSGIAYVRTTGYNQNNDPVLSYARWVMVRKKVEAETEYLSSPLIPDLAPSVLPNELERTAKSRPTTENSGGIHFFDDYKTGDRIDHEDGMTINHSDHMIFTRLYQNSARVHFDAIATDGTPLVYGGIPISVGYAQAFNGLENRLGIRAINGGAHANPVHAGDTLYSLSHVLETKELDTQTGALRLRLIVVKNKKPTADFLPKKADQETGKERYDPGVVLDLDYWELMGRRKPGDPT